MTIKNGLKKLAKLGKVERNEHEAWVVYNGWVISFMPNGSWADDSNIVCVNKRRANDIDDPQSDYSAGGFYRNLSQAIRFAI